jgi:hypothetical protein
MESNIILSSMEDSEINDIRLAKDFKAINEFGEAIFLLED